MYSALSAVQASGGSADVGKLCGLDLVPSQIGRDPWTALDTAHASATGV